MNLDNFFEQRRFSRITNETPSKDEFPLYYEADRQELVINEGEMVFIPAGWWYFVFSEDEFNFSILFLYEETKQSQWKEGQVYGDDVPKVKSHRIEKLDPHKVFEDYELMVHRSTEKYFLPDGNVEYMNFDDFYATQNRQYALLESRCSKLKQYAPKFITPVKDSLVSVNFGNVNSVPCYQLKDGLLCQIHGKQRVLMFRPEERYNLYPSLNYPLDLILHMEKKILGDSFIHLDKLGVMPEICYSMNRTNTFDPELLQKVYKYFMEMYKTIIKDQFCTLPESKDPEFVFNKKETTQPVVFIICLSEGLLRVRNLKFDIKEGYVFVFPNSFLYEWNIDEGSYILGI
jgi:hypothetical protein